MKIQEINIKDIKILENIRVKMKEEDMPFLMQSIKENGLLQPIGVKQEQIDYTLIWGYRRLQAFKKLGYKTIPAVIFIEKDEELTEEEFFVLNATENMQRRPNTLLEFGRVCQILTRTMSNSEIAKRLGVPKNRVQSALIEINRIPKKWHRKIKLIEGKEREGNIPLSMASKIGGYRNLTPVQKDKLLTWVSKTDVDQVKLSNTASLMKEGKSFEDAKESLSKYRAVSFKCLVNTEKYNALRDAYKGETKLWISALNKLAGEEVAISKTGGSEYPQRS